MVHRHGVQGEYTDHAWCAGRTRRVGTACRPCTPRVDTISRGIRASACRPRPPRTPAPCRWPDTAPAPPASGRALALVTYSVRRSGPPKATQVGQRTGRSICCSSSPVGDSFSDAPAFEHRDPVIAFAVHGRAVGTAAVVPAVLVGLEGDQVAPVGDRAAGDVEVVAVDAVAGGVGVVHGLAVRAPGQAVRVGHAARPGQAQLALVEHVHLGLRLVARFVDGADPEAARPGRRGRR